MSSTLPTDKESAFASRGHFLPSLHIRNYRLFRTLDVPRLGAVNLIVGKNTVGKSCLLEAVHLYTEGGSPASIVRVLEYRNEYRAPRYSPASSDEPPYVPVRYLFYGRQDVHQASPEPIHIDAGSESAPFEMEILLVNANDVQPSSLRSRSLRERSPQSPSLDDDPMLAEWTPVLMVKAAEREYVYALDSGVFRRPYNAYRASSQRPRSVLLPLQGLAADSLLALWDSITLRDEEADVVAALRIIEPRVQAVNVVGAGSRAVEPGVRVRIDGIDEPLPLRSLGEGMSRIFEISLAAASAKNGTLLVDEIDSGLHYSVQLVMWRLIFDMARRLNVQVFATTHSWDCIEAFQQAAREDEAQEGVLIRLQRKNDEIVSVLFSEQELAIATRDQIEIR